MRRFGLVLALGLSGLFFGCGQGGQAASAGDEHVPISAPSKAVTQPATRPIQDQPPQDDLAGGTQATNEKLVLSPATSQTSAESDILSSDDSTDVPSGVSGQLIPIDEPRVVAASVLQVNDRFITVDDILQAAGEELFALSAMPSESAFREKANRIVTQEIHRQISQTLVFAEAEQHLTDDRKRQIRAAVAEDLSEMIARADGSKVKLEGELTGRGTSLEYATEQYRRSLTIRRYLRGKFVPALQVNRRMLWNYYCRHREEFTRAKKVQMRLIAAPFAEFLSSAGGQPSEQELAAAKERARQHMAQAGEALASGEAFEGVAGRFSRGIKASSGGVWPMMAAGNFRAEQVEAEAFRLNEGGVSGIIETETGCYIVKARKIQPGQILSFEEAQEQIERMLRQRQSAKLYNNFYAELSRRATVAQSEDFLSVTAGRAVERYWIGGEALGG